MSYWAKDIAQKCHRSDDLASTPPVEAMRLIISIATTSQPRGYYKIVTNDVSRAYFYAPVKEGQYIYVKLPDEDRKPGEEIMCG